MIQSHTGTLRITEDGLTSACCSGRPETRLVTSRRDYSGVMLTQDGGLIIFQLFHHLTAWHEDASSVIARNGWADVISTWLLDWV